MTTSAFADPQAGIALGTSKSFAVLAGAGITNTGPTRASGSFGADFGSSPTVAFTGNSVVTTTGTKYLSLNAATASAKSDLEFAYNDAVGRTPATPITTDLGNLTLTEGAYSSPSSISISGPLTLDGKNNAGAVFIFQAGSTLTTASASSVILINGVQPCNVYWQVGSSASFGISSQFVGHVLALQSIDAGNGATFQGQLLARNGAVTLNTNSIINDGCDPVVLVSPQPVVPPVVPPMVPPVVPPVAPPIAPPVAIQPPVTNAPPIVTPMVPPVLPSIIPPVTAPFNPLPPAIEPLKPITVTQSGGQLPDTDAPNALLLMTLGLILMASGLTGLFVKRRVR